VTYAIYNLAVASEQFTGTAKPDQAGTNITHGYTKYKYSV